MSVKRSKRELEIELWHATNKMAYAAGISHQAPKSVSKNAYYEQARKDYETIKRALDAADKKARK